MEIKGYKNRIIDEKIKHYLSLFGAICVEGPKWCGKTFACLNACKSHFFVGDPTNAFNNRQLAKINPTSVLAGDTPRLIDEWQEVPEIWDAVRFMIDKDQEKGKYLLTGSSTPTHKGILHSGAGRIASIKMKPMSLYESGDSNGKISLKDLFNENIDTTIDIAPTLEQLIYYVMRGGWPQNITVNEKDALILPISYIDAILKSDIQRLDDKERDIHKIKLLLRALARNESTTVSNKTLLNDIKSYDNDNVSEKSLIEYLNIFDRLFLTDNILPFATNIRSKYRVKQMEKRHFVDPSLACAVLNATKEKLYNDLNTFGFLFEGMCQRDLSIYADNIGAKIYHYQDYANNEIDTIIELEEGIYGAFEIKLGFNSVEEAAKKLLDFKKQIIANGGIPPKILAVICGITNAAVKRPDGVYVIPITFLK